MRMITPQSTPISRWVKSKPNSLSHYLSLVFLLSLLLHIDFQHTDRKSYLNTERQSDGDFLSRLVDLQRYRTPSTLCSLFQFFSSHTSALTFSPTACELMLFFSSFRLGENYLLSSGQEIRKWHITPDATYAAKFCQPHASLRSLSLSLFYPDVNLLAHY